MSPRFVRAFALVILVVLFFAGLVMVSAVSASHLPARFSPVSPDNLPNPLTVNGSPL
jgi:hypothetical protein